MKVLPNSKLKNNSLQLLKKLIAQYNRLPECHSKGKKQLTPISANNLIKVKI